MIKKELFSSRLGFILVSAGCAVGLGNVWRFPFIVGQSGGAAFVGFYIACLVLIGVPIMLVEFSIGRASRRCGATAISVLTPEPGKRPWRFISLVSVVGLCLLLSYYPVITGWLLHYTGAMVRGEISGLTNDEITKKFGQLLGSPSLQIPCYLAVLLVSAVICFKGLAQGVEKAVKPLMVAFLLIMIILAGHSLTLGGAKEGMSFYLLPDLSRVEQTGWVSVIRNAVTQAFFTLSLGIGSLLIFGSCIGKEHSLLKDSCVIVVLDTLVAILAGVIIFPACFTYDVSVGAGPTLVFDSMLRVFNAMPGGNIWGSLFFLFMLIAAMTTLIAVLEGVVVSFRELFDWSRRKSSLAAFVILALTNVPACLGYNIWSEFHPLGGESTILDFYDFIVSNNMLPGGALLMLLYCTLKRGWGWDNFIAEANAGNGIKFPGGNISKFYMKYVLPLILTSILVTGYM